jgi:hypothetical protein
VNSNLFVTSDTESSDGVTGLAFEGKIQSDGIASPCSKIGQKLTVDGGLTRKLLKDLGSSSESVTRLSDGDVQNELLNLQLPHGVVCLLGSHGCCY